MVDQTKICQTLLTKVLFEEAPAALITGYMVSRENPPVELVEEVVYLVPSAVDLAMSLRKREVLPWDAYHHWWACSGARANSGSSLQQLRVVSPISSFPLRLAKKDVAFPLYQVW
jgi:hypothetical protein